MVYACTNTARQYQFLCSPTSFPLKMLEPALVSFLNWNSQYLMSRLLFRCLFDYMFNLCLRNLIVIAATICVRVVELMGK